PGSARWSARAPDRRGWHPTPFRPSPRVPAPSDGALRSWSWWAPGPGCAPPPWPPGLFPRRAPRRPCVRSSALAPASEQDEVISMDDLVESLVAEGPFDLPGLRASNPSELVRVVVDQAARKLLAVLGQSHDRPRAKLPFHLHQPGGEQALASLS